MLFSHFKIYTVSFFGHRYIDNFRLAEERLTEIIRDLLLTKEYVEFLVGRDGDFDQIVSSTIRRVKRDYGEHNSAHVCILPYMTAEFRDNEESFYEYYDEVEVADTTHPKSAFQTRNCEFFANNFSTYEDGSDLVTKTEGTSSSVWMWIPGNSSGWRQ